MWLKWSISSSCAITKPISFVRAHLSAFITESRATNYDKDSSSPSFLWFLAKAATAAPPVTSFLWCNVCRMSYQCCALLSSLPRDKRLSCWKVSDVARCPRLERLGSQDLFSHIGMAFMDFSHLPLPPPSPVGFLKWLHSSAMRLYDLWRKQHS